jgi:hypothetical protein
MIDFPLVMLLAFGLIYAVIGVIEFLSDPNGRNLDPKSRCPHEVLFPYFCVFIISVVAFYSFGFFVGTCMMIAAFTIPTIISRILGRQSSHVVGRN